MKFLIDNMETIEVDNKLQLLEKVVMSNGQEADVHVTIRVDHVMFEVIYYDEKRQPVGSNEWIKTFEELAEWLRITERTTTSLADDVREYCRINYIEPARSSGDSTVAIRAGDVHSALGYKNRHPLVCAAIGSKMFAELCRVERVALAGPHSGANTVFTFRIL
jgi:hypothetical protein